MALAQISGPNRTRTTEFTEDIRNRRLLKRDPPTFVINLPGKVTPVCLLVLLYFRLFIDIRFLKNVDNANHILLKKPN